MIETLPNVKTFLGITGTDSDDVLNLIMGYVDSRVKKYTRRDLEQAAITEEFHPTDGLTRTFVLKEAPIDSVAAFTVEFDGDTISSDDYDIYFDEGLVIFKFTPNRATKKLSFSYTGGYASGDFPEDLKMAFTKIVAGVFNNKEAVSGLSSEKFGDFQVNYAGEGASDIDAVIKANSSVLDAYCHHAF